MRQRYILAVDQSTQGTKGLLFDEQGRLTAREDIPHRQLVNEKGWVEHDPREILKNTLAVCRKVIEKADVAPERIAAMGISNQRETTVAWNRETGEPICNAIVWQCARAAELAERHAAEAKKIREKTGIPLSPYFPAAKMAWILENTPAARKLAERQLLCFGTVDSWLIYHLTEEHVHKTDYSNASRTQLFSLGDLCWDKEICDKFSIPKAALPEVCMSDACFGHTTLAGYLPNAIPVCGVLGDSHGALFGQNCMLPGQMKATYGTGSSVMVNIGDKPIYSAKGLATSIAWGLHGNIKYVLEGNLNYTGAVISWLKDEVGLILSASDTARLAAEANPADRAYFVPAFTGLGAPYWDVKATGLLTGITRTTGRKEIVKACLECIAYQITDLVELMRQEIGQPLQELRVDGGPTQNTYLMQFQSDMTAARVRVPQLQELSGMGAAFMAGISAGLYKMEDVFSGISYTDFMPVLEEATRSMYYNGWKQALRKALLHE